VARTEAMRELGRALGGRAITRRELLRRTAGIAAAVPLFARADPAVGATRPRIAIVGGGIAGLTAALTLADRGVPSTVYEASQRLGGRMHSDSPLVPGGDDYFQGQVAEWCGELIDSDHVTIQALARRFHLPLTDLYRYGPKNATETYRFLGRYVSDAEIARAFRPVFATIRKQLRAAPYPTLWNRHTRAALALDRLSLYDWIERYVPGGHRSALGRLLDVAYDEEFGAETRDQSSLNLLYLIADQPKHGFSLYGAEDERYHIEGGNQRLPERIGQHLTQSGLVAIERGRRMNTVALGPNGRISLWFDGSPATVVADYAILATSFAVLRTLDTTHAGFDARKRAAIDKLGAGSNAKLQLQFDERYWNRRGPWGVSDGDAYTDVGIQDTWEPSLGQPGRHAILNDYSGGDLAGSYRPTRPYSTAADNPRVKVYAQAFLKRLESVFPGVSRHWTGRAILSVPALDPNLRCAYSYWRVGQYTSIAGYERVRQGPRGQVHFAGEHCSIDFQGYMEGAALEGVRAAREVLASIRHG
jgi:monoamine oxidase